MNLGGSLTRQNESDSAVNDASPHIANIGRMVEVGDAACWSVQQFNQEYSHPRSVMCRVPCYL